MPYIDVKTAKKLSAEQKIAMKSMFGEKISLIPGKTEARLMILICDEQELYFNGSITQDNAYVKIELFGKNEFYDKNNLTKAIFEFFDTELDIKDLYLSIDEKEVFGAGGVLKR